MSEHPRRETLEGLLLSHLPAGEVKATVAHLLGGCDDCRGEMSPLAAAMFASGNAHEASVAEEDEYDQVISAAFASVLEHERNL
ncbi:MAG TPA: hypothetical protein VIC28_03780, partial [Thermoanaerobaculia bacterium]